VQKSEAFSRSRTSNFESGSFSSLVIYSINSLGIYSILGRVNEPQPPISHCDILQCTVLLFAESSVLNTFSAHENFKVCVYWDIT
jgi:hypothetical protein